MLQSYENAFSKGTVANRERQAKLYIKFSIYYKFNPLNPSYVNVGMYSRFLANSYTSPSTYKNYMSGAKTWVRDHGGSIISFESVSVSTVMKGIQSASNHVPSPAPPITEKELRIIVTYIDLSVPPPLHIKAAILIGFSCMLRSSNLLSPSLASWGGPHTLHMSDIIRVNTGLKVAIRSSKTLRNRSPTILDVCVSNSPILCPVKAWDAYVITYRPPTSGLAFLTPSFLPLTARPVVNVIRSALSSAGYPNPKAYSIHSLRRGATHVAARLGASADELKQQGTWASDSGLRAYLPRPNMVPKRLASALALPPC